MRRDSDSYYSAAETSSITDDPFNNEDSNNNNQSGGPKATSTPIRPKDAHAIKIKSELVGDISSHHHHGLDSQSVGDSGIGRTDSSAGRRTQSLEFLSEDVSSGSASEASANNQTTKSTSKLLGDSGHASRRVQGRSRAPAKRGKSEEIVRQKHKVQQHHQVKPPFVVPKRPLSSNSKDLYLSSSSINVATPGAVSRPSTSTGHVQFSGFEGRKYYSGCSIHSRTPSESSFAPASETAATPYRR